jgi:hypothetical protein
MTDFGHFHVVSPLEILSNTCYILQQAPDYRFLIRRVATRIRQDRRQTDRWVSLDRA